MHIRHLSLVPCSIPGGHRSRLWANACLLACLREGIVGLVYRIRRLAVVFEESLWRMRLWFLGA